MMNLNLLKWLGTGFTILGALLTSLGNWDPYNVWAFNLGAGFWLWASVRMQDAALMAVNASLLTIYVVGTILRISPSL
jgi:phosphoribosylaminoimidazole (AIR) synthetase